MYSGNEGQVIGQQHITSWLPDFAVESKADRDKIIKARLLACAEEHEIGVSNDASTTTGNNASNEQSGTRSVYKAAGSDQELLTLWEKCDSMPDEGDAALIGAAHGRVYNDGSPFPSSVVIEAKRSALRCGVSLWSTADYVGYMVSMNASTSTAGSKKRKRSQTPPSRPLLERMQRLWELRVPASLGLPFPEKLKELEARAAKNQELIEQGKFFEWLRRRS